MMSSAICTEPPFWKLKAAMSSNLNASILENKILPVDYRQGMSLKNGRNTNRRHGSDQYKILPVNSVDGRLLIYDLSPLLDHIIRFRHIFRVNMYQIIDI